jgi:hypothetical protein
MNEAFLSSFRSVPFPAPSPLARGARVSHLGKVRRSRVDVSELADGDSGLEFEFRSAVVRVGYWLGWASILIVLLGLALDVGAQHRWLLVGATFAAAAGNTVAMVIPWQEWLTTRRGQVLLDLWCGGLIAFVALLVADGGSNFSLLLFLAVPFIAVVQAGWRRGFWLAVAAGTCSVVAALIPLSAGATAMRLALVAAVVAVTLVLVRERRIIASRTICRRPPTCCCLAVPTAQTARGSTKPPRASDRSQRCTDC